MKQIIIIAILALAIVAPSQTQAFASEANPYCDLVSDEYMESGGICHDRLDYYDGGPFDGLYPCNDGSARTDWRDCPDVSGFDYSSDDKDNDGRSDSEPRELEEDEIIYEGTPVQGYEEEEGEIEEEEEE